MLTNPNLIMQHGYSSKVVYLTSFDLNS